MRQLLVMVLFVVALVSYVRADDKPAKVEEVKLEDLVAWRMNWAEQIDKARDNPFLRKQLLEKRKTEADSYAGKKLVGSGIVYTFNMDKKTKNPVILLSSQPGRNMADARKHVTLHLRDKDNAAYATIEPRKTLITFEATITDPLILLPGQRDGLDPLTTIVKDGSINITGKWEPAVRPRRK